MFYTIYKITNTLNGKIYIGKHQTKDLNDGYIGSGKHLKRAQAKYGIENFKKEILFQFDNEAEMNAKEAELVTEEFCLREDTYNLCPGGRGGWGYVNTALKDSMIETRRNNLKKIPRETLRQNGLKSYNLLIETGKKGCFTREQNIENSKKAWTDEARSRREKTRADRGFQKGNNNSQHGTMWITDGSGNKKIKKGDIIPEGWYKGRTMLP